MPISEGLSPRSAFGVLRRLYRSVAPTGAPPQALLALWAEFSARLMPPAHAARRLPANTVALAGLLTSRDGLGAAARMLAAELQNDGIGVRPLDIAVALKHPTESNLYAEKTSNAAAEAVIYHANPPLLIAALPHIERQRPNDLRSIGYWVWETERPPSRWRTPLRFIDELWAPSAFAAAALREIAPHHPISVVPHAAALAVDRRDDAQRREVTRSALGVRPGTFVVLTSFSMRSCMARKNPLGAIDAFVRAFKREDDALLIVRVRDGEAYPEGVAELRQSLAGAAGRAVNLMIDQSQPALPDLYAACDAYMSMHRSEGFGLNLAEAMLHERAVVASAWSGNVDFMDARCAEMIPGDLTPLVDPQRLYETRAQRWFDPSVEAASLALRKLAGDEGHRVSLARAGRERAEALLSGGVAATLLRNPRV